jgi:membrane-associated protein
MGLEEFLSQGLSLVGTFNPKIAIFLFLLCLIGDTFVSIPYLVETTWLLAGYQVSRGVLSIYHLLLLMAASQLGRQSGSFILSYFGRVGSMPFIKYKDRFKIGLFKDSSTAKKIFNKINIFSPFSVAFGRMIGLRIPLTLVLGVKRKLRVLSLSVLISGLVFDIIFISLGYVFGATLQLKSIYIFLLFLATLTVIYLLNIAFRYLLNILLRNGKK